MILAGGQGLRLRPLTRLVSGDERPKQFAPLLGSRSLLRMTLDRVGLGIPEVRTVVVTHVGHAGYLSDEQAMGPLPRVLAQPADRGTAAAVLLAAHWISWRDPEGVLALFPSDHFVGNEWEFMNHVLSVAAFARERQWAVLVSAVPTDPETEYGWIEPGVEVGEVSGGGPVRRVARFVEKPALEEARRMMARGWLWNTLVLIAPAHVLVEAGWQALPALSDWLSRIEPFVDSDDEAWAFQHAYRLAPEANFSRSVLEACPPFLAVSGLPATVAWSDLGTPDLVRKSLRTARTVPPLLSDAEGRGTAIVSPRRRQGAA